MQLMGAVFAALLAFALPGTCDERILLTSSRQRPVHDRPEGLVLQAPWHIPQFDSAVEVEMRRSILRRCVFRPSHERKQALLTAVPEERLGPRAPSAWAWVPAFFLSLALTCSLSMMAFALIGARWAALWGMVSLQQSSDQSTVRFPWGQLSWKQHLGLALGAAWTILVLLVATMIATMAGDVMFSTFLFWAASIQMLHYLEHDPRACAYLESLKPPLALSPEIAVKRERWVQTLQSHYGPQLEQLTGRKLYRAWWLTCNVSSPSEATTWDLCARIVSLWPPNIEEY